MRWIKGSARMERRVMLGVIFKVNSVVLLILAETFKTNIHGMAFLFTFLIIYNCLNKGFLEEAQLSVCKNLQC